MQPNRRRADLSFRIDTFVEKKNCLRCYRMHKKYAAESKSNTLDTSQVDLKNNVANLQSSLEQQKQAYRLLSEQLEQIKAQNLTLQNMNLYLSQALSAKAIKENHLASASEKHDLLGIYRNNGYYYVRVTPLFTDVYQYMQEKSLGRNPLKTVTMELVFSTTYLLLGKRNEGFHYMNAALAVMMANNLNSPMGLMCMHMMAENFFIAGKKSECASLLQKTRAMFIDMDNGLMDPNRARLVNDQLTTLSQVMDVTFAKSVSIMWTQWTTPTVTTNQRVDQYLKQMEVSKILDDPMYRSINSPCCLPTFYILRAFSEIIVAIEHQIDCPDDIPVVTEHDITTHFYQLVEYSRMTSDPKMGQNFTRGILAIKVLVAVITSNYLMFDLLMTEVMSAGYLDEENPSPHNSMPLFILLQLLYFVQSPMLTQAVQQFEKWSKDFPSYTEVYNRWVDLVTGPSFYPVQLNELEDYFLVLPHLNYMRQNNITFKMHLPIFTDNSNQIIDVGEQLLLTPFDVSSSPSNDGSHESSSKSPSNVEQNSEISVLGGMTFVYTPIDFAVNEYEIENFVNN